MTYHERKSLVDGLTALILLTGYITYGFTAYAEKGGSLLQDARFWSLTILVSFGVAIVAGIVIQVIFHIALTLRNEVVKEAGIDASMGVVDIESVLDERDRAIASKATRLQYGVVCMGIILMLGLMALYLPVGIALSALFICFVLGMMTHSIVQLYHYRKGA